MKREFYDRFNELGLLKKRYDSLKKGELCVLYGRRRIGKTELVLRFLEYANGKKNKNIYLYINNLTKAGLMQQVSEDIKAQTLDNIKISGNWNAFFDYLEEESKDSKLVLVIDEFQRIDSVSGDFITMLQHKWDLKLKNSSIMIILLGSSIGMTKELVFSAKGPLYGRSTLNIRIKPFRYTDFREMFRYLGSEEERIKYYSVFGGTAYYMALAKDKNMPLMDTVSELILKEGSPLYEEPSNLLSSELRTYNRHNSILISIAKGKKEISDINEPGLEQTQITPYIEDLFTRLDLIKKAEPLLGKKKKTRYDISDNFFRFWFRFVFPLKSSLELKNEKLVFDKLKEQFDSYVSFIMEDIVRELLGLYNGKKIKDMQLKFEEIGSWWEGEDEIDIIALSKRELFLGEVKYSNRPLNGLSILNDLERKSAKIEFNGRVKYIIFSKSGFIGDTKQELEKRGVLCLDLSDLERLFNEISSQESESQRKLSGF